jgi:hypothetical protein
MLTNLLTALSFLNKSELKGPLGRQLFGQGQSKRWEPG